MKTLSALAILLLATSLVAQDPPKPEGVATRAPHDVCCQRAIFMSDDPAGCANPLRL